MVCFTLVRGSVRPFSNFSASMPGLILPTWNAALRQKAARVQQTPTAANRPPTCTAPVALFTVELNWSSCSPAPVRLEGTNPLLAPALADDPVFVELAFMALRFFPRETRELLPPLVACRVVEFVRFLSVFNENSEEQTAYKIFTMSLSFRVQIAPLIARYNNRSETFCFGGSHKESEPREERSSKLPAFSI